MPRVIEILDSDDDAADQIEQQIEKETICPLSSVMKSRSRHKRKSVHQPMRSSPDIQFETISLDGEEDETQQSSDLRNSQLIQMKSICKANQFKTMPTILATKTMSEKSKSASGEIFTENLSTVVRQIAEERVRINYLLTSYGMADIKFSLYTDYERLNCHFENCLKQSKLNT